MYVSAAGIPIGVLVMRSKLPDGSSEYRSGVATVATVGLRTNRSAGDRPPVQHRRDGRRCVGATRPVKAGAVQW